MCHNIGDTIETSAPRPNYGKKKLMKSELRRP